MRARLKFSTLMAEFALVILTHRITLWSLWWLAVGTLMLASCNPALAGGGISA